jgi:hypothetical protein
MQKTISSLVSENLKRQGKGASALDIKKAYHRNYKYRRGDGRLSQQLVADQISKYLILNIIS